MSEVSEDIKESLRLIEDLKFFLATAPANWQDNQVIRRYYLNNDEGFVSCVYWNNLYFITGTDIVRCILYKFQHFGRAITDRKKFEEGIFSDLRNLKAGEDAVLENPKSDFLEFLYKNSCLRTQKKQKVFYWFNVPHDKLMADALERDIKKERMGQVPTSVALREPALLFHYEEDKSKSLYEQLSAHLSLPRFDVDGKLDEAPDSPEYGEGQQHLTADDNGDDINDEDDDFPLDYLDKGAMNDYITFDSNYQSGSYINAYDSNFDRIDPILFQNPVNVANTDDYLIEQTVPIHVATSSAQMMLPRQTRIDDLLMPFLSSIMPTTTGAQFPHSAQYSLSAQFPPSAVMTHCPPSALVTQFPQYDPGYYYHDASMVSHSDADFYQPPMASLQSVVHFEPPPPNGYYGYYDDYDYSVRLATPSQRQQEISASMMRKRQQLQLRRGVRKPERGTRIVDYEARLKDHMKRKEVIKSEETLILTPESSIATDLHQTQI